MGDGMAMLMYLPYVGETCIRSPASIVRDFTEAV